MVECHEVSVEFHRSTPVVTNSLCIYHGRKEKEKEERRKENIPEDNDRGLQGYSGDYELSKLSSGSRAWKTNDARGKSRFSISMYTQTFVRRKQVYSPVDQPILTATETCYGIRNSGY